MSAPQYHSFTVETPDGDYVIDAPTFQGADAAERRVFFTMLAKGYEPEDLVIRYEGMVEYLDAA